MVTIATATAVGRTVFVLGKEAHGNRQAVIVGAGEEYNSDSLAVGTITAYTDQTARYPYEV